MRRLGVAEAIVDGLRLPGDVAIEGDEIVAVGLEPAGSGIAIPGLVDVQVNGFAGVDFLGAEVEQWLEASRRLLAAGVTTFLPTLITAAPQTLVAALGRAERAMRAAPAAAARIAGVHLEGPFISPERLGAHPVEHRRDPDPSLLEDLLAAGPVRMLTLAPELDGSFGLIELLRRRHVAVSLGHTTAPAEVAHAAFECGAVAVTHVFNAMEPIRGREPGVAGAALSRPDVAVLCIVDGVHLAEEAVRLVFGRRDGIAVLTSDAIAAAGMGDGEYLLGEERIAVAGRRATRADGTLAGSVGAVADALPLLVHAGVPLERAVEAATAAPARLLGRADIGTLRPGATADVVILDDALRVGEVILGGEPVMELEP